MSNGQWNVSVFSKLWFVFSSLISSVIVVNSWGGLSHDLAKGKFFDFGTFSPCFQIERNATHHYDTQYCIAQLKFRATEVPRRTKAAPWFVYMWKKIQFNLYDSVWKINRLEVELPQISLGMCLPAICSADQLAAIGNEAIHSITNQFDFEVPRIACQSGVKYKPKLEMLDLFAM